MSESGLSRTPTVEHGVHAPGDEDGPLGTLVSTPYNLDFVEDLKAEWPARERRWFPALKVWWIEEPADEEYVEELVEYHYGHVRIIDAGGDETYRDSEGEFRQERLL